MDSDDVRRSFGDLWIGLTDQATEGTWVWSSGQTVSYTNWASGQPNSGTSYKWGWMSCELRRVPDGRDVERHVRTAPLAWSDRVERYGDGRFGGWSRGAIPAGRGRGGPGAAEGDGGESAAGSWRQHVVGGGQVGGDDQQGLGPSTVNVNDQMVWKYNGHFSWLRTVP